MLARRSIFCALFVATAVGASVLLGDRTGAQTLSTNEAVTPGPNSGARLMVGGLPKYLVFSRRSDNIVQYRMTDGQTYSGFSPVIDEAAPGHQAGTLSYPAAASVYDASGVPTSITVVVRGGSGHLWVTSAYNSSGTTVAFKPWKDLTGFTTSAAPALAWFKPTTGAGAMNLFYRDLATSRIRSLMSADGYNTWGSVIDLSAMHVDASETMTSAPVALVSKTVDQAQQKFLQLFFRTSTSNIVRDCYTFTPATPSSWVGPPLSHDSYKTSPLTQLNSSDDPCIVSNVGGVMTASDPTNFLSYHIPEMQAMKARIVKFQMSYDNQWNGDTPPAHYTVSYQDILAAGQGGAHVIILRTADSKTKTGNIDKFMNTMTFPDASGSGAGKSIKDLPTIFPFQNYIIEVGNEPNQALGGRNPTTLVYGFPATTARDQAVAAGLYIQTKIPLTDATYGNWKKFKWICSMPIIGTDVAYLNTFMTPSPGNSNKTVFDVYSGFGVHAYSFGTLYWNNTVSTTQHPLALLDTVLARLPEGKDVLITECNINTPGVAFPDWQTNGTRLKQVLYATPACVRGWTYFALDTGPTYNITGHDCYGIDEKAGQVVSSIAAVNLLVGPGIPQPAVQINMPLAETKAANSGISVGDTVVLTGCESVHSPTDANVNLNGYWNVLQKDTTTGPGTILYLDKNIVGWTTSAYPLINPTNNRPGRIARSPLLLETSPVARPCATTVGTR